MACRICGLGLLALCALAVHGMASLVRTLPHHQPSAIEMLLSLIAVLAMIGGSASLIIGPALFRPYRWPREERD